MAITGAIFNSLIYGDVNSADYGVYISGDAVFNAPQRSVELVSVPGRNGSIAIDQGHFENIEVEYPAGMFGDDKTDFRQRLSDFRNAIMSQKGYQRLSDTYHPDEYRMGMYVEGLEVDPTHYNEAGQFTLKFNCKPQRYLTSGEEEIDVTDWSDVKTLSGESVTFDDGDTSKGFQSIKTVFNPSQDGTPWKSEVESAPYLFRQSSGGTVAHEYDSESDAIVGGTVAWNQLIPGNRYRTDGSYVGLTSVRDVTNAYIHVQGTTTMADNFRVVDGAWYERDHVYLAQLFGVDSPDCCIDVYDNVRPYGQYYRIWKTSYITLALAFKSGVTINADIHCDIIDLTSLFGSSTIADYLYSLEQSTAGAGVAKLRSWGFDIDSYHAYDAGSLQSANVSAHETVGFNQWDEEWEAGAYWGNGTKRDGTNSIRTKNYVPVVPNTQYYVSVTSQYIQFYDSDKNWLGNAESTNQFTTPADCHYIQYSSNFNYGTTYNNDICINISSDRNGEYEPYINHSYPLDSDVTLRGLFKLDANNNLYAEGDVYLPSGSVSRNFGIRAYQSGDESLADAITDGTNTVYKLSTPTTETADPYTPIQTVDPYGTEEYIDYGVEQGTRDIAVPVGHQTKYIERVPIEGKTQMKTYVSPTNRVEDATEYTTSLNGTKYGGTLDVISGKLDKTHEGITYTGQTINEPWLSDCDEYQQGATPTYGATVVYELTTPTRVSLTAQAVAMLNGTNVIWADADSVEVKYGFEPGTLYNPTRFDAQPLLAVEGYGDIEFNGYKIELENGGRYGMVELIEETNREKIGTNNREEFTLTFPLDLRTFNTGDTFWSTINIIFWFTTSTETLYADTVSMSGLIEEYSFYSHLNHTGQLNPAINPSTNYYKGQSQTETGELVITIRNRDSSFTATVQVVLTKRYDATASTMTYAITINIINMQGPESIQNSRIEVSVEGQGYSTMAILGNPTYIDCGLGEAYRYIDGEPVSLNKYIDLGSDLPVLAPGVNEITYPSTVTDLKVKPNWWKI